MSIKRKVGPELVVGKDGTKGWTFAVYESRVLVVDDIADIANARTDRPPITWRGVEVSFMMGAASRKKFTRIPTWGIILERSRRKATIDDIAAV